MVYKSPLTMEGFMSSVNSVFLVGNLGKDPETKQFGQDNSVCSFSVATEYKTQAGQAKTSWHNIQAWGKTGENCAKYLKKGSKVCIEGRIDYNESEKNGVKTYFTNIVANKVTFLSSVAKDQAVSTPVIRDNPVSSFAPDGFDNLPF